VGESGGSSAPKTLTNYFVGGLSVYNAELVRLAAHYHAVMGIRIWFAPRHRLQRQMRRRQHSSA